MFLTAPLGLIGVVAALLIFQAPLGFVAILGVTALVRDDHAQLGDPDRPGAGRDGAKAATPGTRCVEAAVHRTRPVALTAAATVLAMVPLDAQHLLGPDGDRDHGRPHRRDAAHDLLRAGALCGVVQGEARSPRRRRRKRPPCLRRQFDDAHDHDPHTCRTHERLPLGVLACLLAGCATNHALMPIACGLHRTECEAAVCRCVARSPRPGARSAVPHRSRGRRRRHAAYTAERSRSIAFGSATIEFGRRRCAWSHDGARPLPPDSLRAGETPSGMRRAPGVLAAHAQAKQRLQDEVAKRLAVADRKEVVIFVHGYRVTFEDAALTMGEMCHFLGREFVCGIFTWPAGSDRGDLFGYDVDRRVRRIRGRGPGQADPHHRGDARSREDSLHRP